MKRDEIAHGSARAKLLATWGPAVAARSDVTALAEALLGREQAIVRVELLATDRLDAPPEIATLARLDGATIQAHFLGAAPSVENALSGGAFLFLVPERAESLVPGAMLTARLPRAGAGTAGWLIPRAAVVRHLGRGWCYVRGEAETFTRREIALDRPHADGWLVVEEIAAPVVVAGAQSLLSEELKGGIQMKD